MNILISIYIYYIYIYIYYKIQNSKIIIHKLIRLLLYIGIPTSDMGQVDHSKTGRLTIGSICPVYH